MLNALRRPHTDVADPSRRQSGNKDAICPTSQPARKPMVVVENRGEHLAPAGSLSTRHRVPSRYASLELAAGRPGFRTLGSTANVEAAAGAFAVA